LAANTAFKKSKLASALARSFEGFGVDGERAALGGCQADLEGACRFIRGGLGFGEGRARLRHALFERAAKALLNLVDWQG
jgi:hypothetical protein